MVAHPGPPQIRARAINAHGSSSHTIATLAIRGRFVGTVSRPRWTGRVALPRYMELSPSLPRVPRVSSPGSAVLWDAPTPGRSSRRVSLPSLGDTTLAPIRSHRPGRTAGGTGSWYSGSRAGDVGGNGRVSQVPERPSCPCALLLDPGRTRCAKPLRRLGAAPAWVNDGGSRE